MNTPNLKIDDFADAVERGVETAAAKLGAGSLAEQTGRLQAQARSNECDLAQAAMSEPITLVVATPDATASFDSLTRAHPGAPLGARALIGIGLVGGIAAAAIGPRRLGRVGAGLFGAGVSILRSAVGTALVSALLSHWFARSQARSQSLCARGPASSP